MNDNEESSHSFQKKQVPAELAANTAKVSTRKRKKTKFVK
jgi:hypothetical protein